MPSFCIGLARRPTNAWQNSRREQATQRPSRPQNQPNEERMRSTHPRKRLGCYAWYHSHNKASPCLAKLCSDHEIFNTKIKNFANFECFTKFLCLENLELYCILKFTCVVNLAFWSCVCVVNFDRIAAQTAASSH